MARVAFTGFEWRSTAESIITSSGTFSFNTATVKPGGSVASLRINPTGSGTGYVELAGLASSGAVARWNAATVWISVDFLFATAPASGSEWFLATGATGGNGKLRLRLTSERKIAAYAQDQTTLLGTGTTVLSPATWYLLDIKCGTGTSGEWEVRINGISEISGTGNVETGNNGSIYFGKSPNIGSNSVDYFFDNVWVDDAAYKGAHVVVAKVPNANGTTMQWTAGTGVSDYQEVDEAVPSATEYVQSTANNDLAHFNLENSATAPAISGTIHGVLVLDRLQGISAASGTVRVSLLSNATTIETTNIDTGAPATTLGLYRDTDPDTSAAWTTGGIDAVQIGAVEITGTDRYRLHTATLMVSFTAGGAAQYTQATADTAQFTELLARQAGKAVAETVGLTEAQTRQLQRTLADTLTLTEALSRLVQRAPIAETLGLTENLASAAVKLKDLGGETLGLTEALTRAALKTLGESVSLTEAVAREVRRALADTLGLSESVTRRVARALAETLSLTEGLTPVLQPASTVGDVIRVLSEVFAMAGGSNEAFAMAGGSNEAFAMAGGSNEAFVG